MVKNEIIYIPKFDTKKMIKKDEKKEIDNKTKREMQTLSHCKFRERLINKAETEGIKVNICTERMTSQTCGKCFDSYKIGKSELYKCPSCKIYIERDINGARNVLIKYIKEIII